MCKSNIVIKLMKSRKLNTRIKELTADIKYNKWSTPFAKLRKKETLQNWFYKRLNYFFIKISIAIHYSRINRDFLRNQNMCNYLAPMGLSKIWKEMPCKIRKNSKVFWGNNAKLWFYQFSWCFINIQFVLLFFRTNTGLDTVTYWLYLQEIIFYQMYGYKMLWSYFLTNGVINQLCE